MEALDTFSKKKLFPSVKLIEIIAQYMISQLYNFIALRLNNQDYTDILAVNKCS